MKPIAFYTIREAACSLGVNHKTLRRWIKSPDFPLLPIRVHPTTRHRVFVEDDLTIISKWRSSPLTLAA